MYIPQQLVGVDGEMHAHPFLVAKITGMQGSECSKTLKAQTPHQVRTLQEERLTHGRRPEKRPGVNL